MESRGVSFNKLEDDQDKLSEGSLLSADDEAVEIPNGPKTKALNRPQDDSSGIIELVEPNSSHLSSSSQTPISTPNQKNISNQKLIDQDNQDDSDEQIQQQEETFQIRKSKKQSLIKTLNYNTSQNDINLSTEKPLKKQFRKIDANNSEMVMMERLRLDSNGREISISSSQRQFQEQQQQEKDSYDITHSFDYSDEDHKKKLMLKIAHGGDGGQYDKMPYELDPSLMLNFKQIKDEFESSLSNPLKQRLMESFHEPIGGEKSFQSTFDPKQCSDIPKMIDFVKSVKKANLRKEQKQFGIIPEERDEGESLNSLKSKQFLKKETSKIIKSLSENLKEDVEKQAKKLLRDKDGFDLQKYVIRRQSMFFQTWSLINVITCILSSFQYAFMTAFGEPESGSPGYIIDKLFEFVFVSDALLQFVVEYENSFSRKTIRDPYKIAINYFKGRFLFDAVTIIPFAKLFTNMPLNRLFYVVKCLRLQKGFYLLDTAKFKQTVRGYYQTQRNKYICKMQADKNSDPMENIYVDRTQINTQIYIIYQFRFFKLMLFILGSSYFVGMFWYILCDINIYYNNIRSKENPEYFHEEDNFIDYFNMNDYTSNWQKAIINQYFAFTSLSTVGFGDFHPTNSFERMLCAIIIMFGNGIFGLIIGMFNDMIVEIKSFNSEIEDADNLNSFFSLLTKLNKNYPMNQQLKYDIESFFQYKWNNDPNYALTDVEDQKIMDQLPSEVLTHIYTKFMFTHFLQTFRGFFTLFKDQDKMTLALRLDLFSWQDFKYKNFMLQILQKLEPRMTTPHEIIYNELQDVDEIMFLEKGSIDLGYYVDGKKLFKLRFKEFNVVGSFYVTFDRKAMFITKSYTYCTGYFIRKRNWLQVLVEVPEVARPLKNKILQEFYAKIRKPMLVQKNRDIKNLCSNSKYKSLYNEVDLSKNDFYAIMRETTTAHKKDVAKKQELTPREIEIMQNQDDLVDQFENHIDGDLLENLMDRFEGMSLLSDKIVNDREQKKQEMMKDTKLKAESEIKEQLLKKLMQVRQKSKDVVEINMAKKKLLTTLQSKKRKLDKTFNGQPSSSSEGEIIIVAGDKCI